MPRLTLECEGKHTDMTLNKNTFVSLISLCMIVALTSCHSKTNTSFLLRTNYDGATPGTVNLTLEAIGGLEAHLNFSITGGTPNLPITCYYYIFDYTSTNPLIGGLPHNLSFSLNDTGSNSIDVTPVLCSQGNPNSYITWSCNISLPPFTILTATSEGGNSFFFNCPS